VSVDTDSFDGHCDVWEESLRRARKEHKCDACHEPIQRGELYHATRSLFDGRWDTTYRCARCETMYRFLQPLMARGEVCHEELDCGHEFTEVFNREPPPEVAALAFMSQAEAQALLGPGGLRTQLIAERKRVAAERLFREKARIWFRNAENREWRCRVMAAQGQVDAARVAS
jgi:hypothetical protein